MLHQKNCSRLWIRSLVWINVFSSLVLYALAAPDVATLQSELTALKGELSKFKADIFTQEKKFGDLISTLVSTQARTNSDLSRLKKDVTSLQAITNTTVAELNDVKLTCNATSSELNTLQNDVITVQVQTQITTVELASINRRVDDLQINVTQNIHNLASIDQELSRQNVSLQNIEAKNVTTLLAQVAQDIQAVQIKEAELSVRVGSMSHSQNLSEQMLRNMSRELRSMKSDLQPCSKNVSNLSIGNFSDFNAVKTDVDKVRSELDILKVEAVIQSSQIDGLVKDSGMIHGAVSNLTLELRGMGGSLPGIASKQELDTVQTLVLKLKSDLNSSETEIAKLEVELMQSEIRTSTKLRNVTLQVETMKSDTDIVNEMLRNLTLQYNTDVSSIKTDIIYLMSVVRPFDTLALELDKVSNVSNLLKTDFSKIQSELQALKSQIMSTKGGQTLSNTSSQLQADIDRMTLEVLKLYSDVNILKYNNNQTSDRMKNITSELHKVKVDVTLAMSKVSSFANDTQGYKTDIQSLKRDSQTLSQDLSKLSSKVTQLDGELQTVKTTVSKLDNAVQQCTTGNNQGLCGNTPVTQSPGQVSAVPHGHGPCPLQWSHYDGYCFRAISTPATWLEAGEECMFSGGKLVSLESEHKSDLLQQFLQTVQGASTWWIGGTDELVEGHWIWVVTDDLFTYTNWAARNAPTHDERDCLLVDRRHQYTWSDETCGAKTPFVCEILLPHTA